MSTTLITSSQIRAARHLANLSQADLRAATGLSLPTIRRAESERDVSVSDDAIAAIQQALETAGIEFIAENGGGAGVRLRKEPYSVRHLANVVQRFQINIVKKLSWNDLKFEALANGFEIWSKERRLGTITVADERAVFEPPLTGPRTRADDWVTEDELRVWIDSLRRK